MQYRLLGRTGVRVSRLCFGTMSFGGDADEETSAEMFRRCLCETLAERVLRGDLDEEHAIHIGRLIMRENALSLYRRLSGDSRAARFRTPARVRAPRLGR